jgi:hypothetical protein
LRLQHGNIDFRNGPYNAKVNEEFEVQYDNYPMCASQGFDRFQGISWGQSLGLCGTIRARTTHEKDGQQDRFPGGHKTGAVGSGGTGLPDANLRPGPFKCPTQANRHNQNTAAEHGDVADAKQSEPRLICQ